MIQSDSQVIEMIASKMQSYNSDLVNNINELNTIYDELSTYWQDDNGIAFVNKVKEQNEQMKLFSQEIETLAESIHNVSKNLASANDAIKQSINI